MPCPPNEIVIAYIAGELDAVERARVETHVAGCGACTGTTAAVAAARRAARGETLEDPPVQVLAHAAQIPSERRNRSLRALAGRVAELVVDTFRDPLPLGARSTAASARQSLFRALDYDIDVRVSSLGGDVRVSGQVLPGPDRAFDSVSSLEIALVGVYGDVALVETNALGEFDFGARTPGDYALVVEAEEDRLVVDPLSARVD